MLATPSVPDADRPNETSRTVDIPVIERGGSSCAGSRHAKISLCSVNEVVTRGEVSVERRAKRRAVSIWNISSISHETSKRFHRIAKHLGGREHFASTDDLQHHVARRHLLVVQEDGDGSVRIPAGAGEVTLGQPLESMQQEPIRELESSSPPSGLSIDHGDRRVHCGLSLSTPQIALSTLLTRTPSLPGCRS